MTLNPVTLTVILFPSRSRDYTMLSREFVRRCDDAHVHKHRADAYESLLHAEEHREAADFQVTSSLHERWL